MADLVIKNGKVVTRNGILSIGIAVDKGKIVAISKEAYLPSADRVIDASGKYVLPGLVDPHVHLGYKGEFGEQVRTESRAAVGGGVTTWGEFLFLPHKGFLEIFEEHKNAHEKNAVCDGFFHNSCSTQKAIDEIPDCPQIGVNSFKFNLGYKGPRLAMLGKIALDDGVMLIAWRKIAALGRPAWAMVHAEDADMVTVGREIMEKKLKRKDFAAWRDSRPNYVESIQIMITIEIARITDCPLYIVHNTVGEAIDLIGMAKARGQEVVGETCPQYLTHTSDDPILQMFRDNPALGVVNPPLRDQESIEKLWKGLRDGTIETVGSDHVPLTLEHKGTDLWTAPMGLSNMMELILPVMLSEGVNQSRISLEKLVEVCCYNPARVFGLTPEKGAIAVGADADIVIVDLEKKVKLTLDMLHSSADWNMYEGWNFTGWPVMTLLRGQIVMENGKILAKPGIGKYVPCKCN